ncbi:unnamed protein product [Tilletia controversa]|nr:unnamed protein product [Tilletia controversa]
MKCISAPAIVAFLLSSAILSAAQPVPVLRTQERAARPVERPHGASPDGALALRTLVSDSDALSARANGYLAKRGLFDIFKNFGSKFMALAEKNPKTAIAATTIIGLTESLMERDNMLMSDANDVRRFMMVASDRSPTNMSLCHSTLASTFEEISFEDVAAASSPTPSSSYRWSYSAALAMSALLFLLWESLWIVVASLYDADATSDADGDGALSEQLQFR